MKGTYVIVVAFVALSAMNVVSLDRDEQGIILPIPTACPYPAEEFPNVTTNIAHEYNCSRFYKCHVGNAISQDCPLMNENDPLTRLHFNRLEQVCDWPWRAGCDSCPPRYENGTYPPPSRINDGYSCNYYECINSKPYPRTCPPGTCFSRTCQECVVNRNGGYCGDLIPTPPPTTPSTETPSTETPPPPLGRCDSPADNGNKKPLHCDCKVYYECEFPVWWRRECTGGLHFSPTKKICLPPNDAGCWIPKK